MKKFALITVIFALVFASSQDTLSDLGKRLKRGYEYIIYPEMMGDMPVALEKMAKRDENGTVIGYYSINELSTALGKDFQPIEYLKDENRTDSNGSKLRLMLIHWSFDKGKNADGVTDEQATIDLLLSKGLLNMREGVHFAKDINFTSLSGYEFGIFGSSEIADVPKVVPTVEVIE